MIRSIINDIKKEMIYNNISWNKCNLCALIIIMIRGVIIVFVSIAIINNKIIRWNK